MIKRKTHKTKRLILRPYKLSDHAAWFDVYVHRLPQRNKYDVGPLNPKRCSIAEFRKMMKRHERVAKEGKGFIYAAFEKQTGELIGVIDLFVIAREFYQMGNLGYRIHNQYWGRGYGKEIALAALKIGFSELKLNRLEAVINLDNRRSIALAKSIGLRREGVRKRYIFENNAWTDHIVYAANPEDIGLKSTRPSL